MKSTLRVLILSAAAAAVLPAQSPRAISLSDARAGRGVTYYDAAPAGRITRGNALRMTPRCNDEIFRRPGACGGGREQSNSKPTGENSDDVVVFSLRLTHR